MHRTLGFLLLAALAGCGPQRQTTDPDGDGCSTARPCPGGFVCEDGLCLQAPADAGSTPEPDAGEAIDAGSGDVDAGPSDAGTSPCAGVTCSGHGSCVAGAGGASCQCTSGYHANGLACEPDGAGPTASFTISKTTATGRERLTLNAGASTGTNLQFRWDFEDDGEWDTTWGNASSLQHRWQHEAAYTAVLEVKDGASRTARATAALTVTPAGGTPTWIGISDNLATAFGWWTVVDFEGAKLSDTEVHMPGASSYTKVHSARQISDGRVVTAVECLSEATCTQNELAVVGAGGRVGSLAAFTSEFPPTDFLELPGGRWLVSSRDANAIIELDTDGEPTRYWAQNLAGPTGLELSADGRRVLVALSNAGRIDEYRITGTKIGRWDDVGALSAPYTFKRAASGRYLVADLAGKVVEFEANGNSRGTLLDATQVQVPRGLAELPDGRLLVGEDCSTTYDACGYVKVFDRNTGTIDRFTPPLNVSWKVYNPDGIVVPVP